MAPRSGGMDWSGAGIKRGGGRGTRRPMLACNQVKLAGRARADDIILVIGELPQGSAPGARLRRGFSFG